MSAQKNYWIECVSEALEAVGLSATDEQTSEIAAAIEVSHENYGMAFYSPPASDRLSSVEREWQQKYVALEQEFERYRSGAERAVRTALQQPHDASVGISSDGSVTRYDGRCTRIL